MKNLIVKNFPLPRIQCGAPLGNSYLGLLVWGESNHLNLTVGTNTTWDHRGGLPWTPKIRYKEIKGALRNKNAAALKEIFAYPPTPPGTPRRPQIVPVGRIELELPANCTLLRYELNIGDGGLEIVYDKGGKERSMSFRLDQGDKKSFLFKGADIVRFQLVDSYTLSCGILHNAGFAEPLRVRNGNFQSFTQKMPADPDFALACRRDGELFTCRFARGDEEIAALKDLQPGDWAALKHSNTQWWKKYWKSIPEVKVDNEILSELYWFGLYKFGSMSDPSGVAAGLQGPWIEDDDFPPWSADYHFNINVQMCYGPAYRANRFENLMPIFNMIRSWKETLRMNAKFFVGIDDGYMLPHAVDDRGTCMGGFWSGAIDHGCSAWMSQMMFDYCDYTGDTEFLRDFVYDFMKGVMEVFLLMIEPDGDKLKLAVSISPEFRGSLLTAWGENSSFQLAAIHRLAMNLIAAAKILQEKPDPAWQDLLDRLPAASVEMGGEGELIPDQPEIALWRGLCLPFSHRHHSHLAGICPFNVIDPESPEWRDVAEVSRLRWIHRGMGAWSGWSTAWAAQLNSHLKQADNAELLLELFNRIFVNCGGGTLHDNLIRGYSMMREIPRREVMQIDGAMGAVSAIQEMFLYDCGGVLHIGDGIPDHWKEARVTDMPGPGGFRISATFRQGKGKTLTLKATRDGVAKILLRKSKRWPRPAKGTLHGEVWEVALKAGERITL